ncbi:MAG: HlyD family efflux transporter periplasmic adaptor subunit [Eubacteriales bacterium]|nr:HlyD family efflux transporter periplasmic adaptor subunit [Eubacteriales bacterium]
MKRRKKWIVIVAVLLVVFIGGKLLLDQNQTIRYAEDTATIGNLVTYYNFSGSLDVTKSMTVLAPSDTTVSEIYVEPNSVIPENTRLMRLTDGTILKAEIAGEVTSIDVAKDSVVSTGDALLEMMDLSSMKATFKVDEYDVSTVTIGKTVTITVDGIGANFEAPISAINKHAVQSGDLSYYVATVDLTGVSLPQDALPGMQISVDVLNQQVENAILLKIDSVSFESDNIPFVYMRNGKTIERNPDEEGFNDGVHVQITKGLQSGDIVLYVPTAAATLQEIMTQRSKSNISSGVQ